MRKLKISRGFTVRNRAAIFRTRADEPTRLALISDVFQLRSIAEKAAEALICTLLSRVRRFVRIFLVLCFPNGEIANGYHDPERPSDAA